MPTTKTRPSADSDNKPERGGIYDKAGYDSEYASKPNLNDKMGSSPNYGGRTALPPKNDDPGEQSPEQLEEREATGDSDGSRSAGDTDNQSADNGADGNDNSIGSGYKNEGGEGGAKERAKNFFSRHKKKVIGGGAGLGAGTVIMILLGTATGPVQLLHFSEFIKRAHFSSNEESNNKRSARYMFYLLAGSAHQGRLGYGADKYANRWEKRINTRAGLKSVYANSYPNRLIGYQVIDQSKARGFLQDAKIDGIPTATQMNGQDGNGNPINNADGDFVDLRGESTPNRRGVIKSITKGLHINGASSALVARVLKKRCGCTFHPIKNRINDVLERRKMTREQKEEDKKRADAEREAERKNGAVDTSGVLDPENRGDLDTEEGKAQTKNNLKLKLLASTAAAVGIFCTVRDFGDQVEETEYKNNILPMMRMGTETLSAGDQVKTGKDINIDEVGYRADALYDPKLQESWVNASSIKYENGQDPSKGRDINPEAKPDELAGKPALFDIVDGVKPLGALCDAVNWALNQQGIKQVAGAIQAVVYAVTPIDEIVEKLVDWAADEAVDAKAVGPAFGNYANYGGRLAANDQAIAQGGRRLNAEEEDKIRTVLRENQRQEFAQKSVYERYLAVSDYRSFAGKMVYKIPTSVSNAAASLVDVPNTLNSIIGSIFSSLTGKVSAAGEFEYNYGFSKYGDSLEEQNITDEAFSNPFKNACYMEFSDMSQCNVEGATPDFAKLKAANERWGDKCFGLTITPETGAPIYDQAKKQHLKDEGLDGVPEECSVSKEEDEATYNELLHYRFYLKDTLNEHGLACYEGDEQACGFLDVGNVGTGAAAVTDSEDLYGDSSNTPCAEGTKDVGVHDGYRENKKVRIKLCAVSNIASSAEESNGGAHLIKGADGKLLVNAKVSERFFKLAEEASKNGITLSAVSGYRSMAKQQQLCNEQPACSNGDFTTIAEPGYSNHQMGLATDFSMPEAGFGTDNCINVDGICTGGNDPVYKWLVVNAEKFKIKQLKNEFWHWSADGS